MNERLKQDLIELFKTKNCYFCFENQEDGIDILSVLHELDFTWASKSSLKDESKYWLLDFKKQKGYGFIYNSYNKGFQCVPDDSQIHSNITISYQKLKRLIKELKIKNNL